ncbi:tetratricopeptide repeat protein [Flavobacterium humi]|uniref:Tetratricopeptide repeat protein n=1 Tax=Flavobacterium humi TaxID=2562683 RepID=A0A4Z0L7F0_9FLAO|nr:tetratricopeptide repeat protein [Flavobacterium humi]TGD57045.1 tetratricopeptide repeat protein [Flavobacterium humi]
MFKNKCKFRFLTFVFLLLLPTISIAQGNSKIVCEALIEKGKEALNKNQYSRSLQLLTDALNLAKKNDWGRQQFLALNNIGANYYMLLEHGEALNYYLEAYTLAIKKLGTKEEMTVLNNIAILYFEEEDYPKANDYFKRAYKIAKERKDFVKIGLYAVNLGNSANGTGNYKLGRAYFNEALPLLTGKEEFLTLAKIGLCACDLNDGKSEQARKSAEELLKTAKSLDFNETGILLYTVIARAYLNENKLDKAQAYVAKVLSLNPSPKMKLDAFGVMSEIHFRKKNYQTAFQYKDSIIKTNKNLDKAKNSKFYENSKVKLGIINYKNQLTVNENRRINERKIFYSIIAGILIIVISVIWVLRSLSIKYKQRKIIAERDRKILELELIKKNNESLQFEKECSENKTILLSEQERLKKEIELKNRKLSVKALYLSGRNQMIENILSELSRLAQVSKNNVLITQMESLRSHLDLNNDWNDFVTHFEEVNQGFLTALKTKHTNLSVNDIRYISYIYMNLNNKEIASMLNISQDSSRKRKERITSKMELPDSVNLYDYLASLH